MAAEVEVVSADQPVRVGDAELSTGESRTVTEPTDVKVGDSLVLMIHPGGGESLAGAREEVRRLSGNLRRSLDEHGLESIAEASEVVARRTDLKSGMDNAEAAFKELDAEGLKEACISAANELAAAEAEVKRRRDQVADAGQPSMPGGSEIMASIARRMSFAPWNLEKRVLRRPVTPSGGNRRSLTISCAACERPSRKRTGI